MAIKYRLTTFIREYPLPVVALCGLGTGAFAHLIGQPAIAMYAWRITLVLGGIPIIIETIHGMLKGKFASDIVAMLAILTAGFMGQDLAGAIIVLMQSGGEALEAYGLRRASSSLDALLARAPKKAYRRTDGSLQEINVEQVRIGDILVIRSGDLVPVDGSILQGEADLDESAMTGEPLTHRKLVGAKVLSGSVNVGAAFEISAEKLCHDSQYAKIVELVKKAQTEKAPIQRLADRYATYFTPITLVMSALGWWWTGDSLTALSVLVVATPCPLILATPIAVISGINRAARAGIIVKGGAPLEELARVRAMVFDKTGTITYGIPTVDGVIPTHNISEDELLYHAACLEQFSSHSVAQAIAAAGKNKFGKLTLPEQVEEIAGRGMKGLVNSKMVYAGSVAFITEILDTQEKNELTALTKNSAIDGRVVTCVALEGKLAGVITLSDHLRTEVPTMLARLQAMSIKKILLLTGDSQQNAAMIAHQAGITDYYANLLPEQKVEHVQALMNEYKAVAMVGDGINDAPALATATVGIAMGARGAAISAEAADVVLLADDASKVAEALFIGRRMLKIATEGIMMGMGLSFVLMIIAVFGHIQPATGALLQEVIDIVVIINALRAR